jgi:hypothetical protein
LENLFLGMDNSSLDVIRQLVKIINSHEKKSATLKNVGTQSFLSAASLISSAAKEIDNLKADSKKVARSSSDRVSRCGQ